MKFNYAGIALAFGVAFSVAPVAAQEASQSHLQAARAAVDAIGATDEFDGILPQAAMALKAELIQKNPDQAQLIGRTVDEKALALASRRADLEREAAAAFARGFSEEELVAVSEFYNSEAGRKLIEQGPVVTREVLQAADIWQSGIARDLAVEVARELDTASGGPTSETAEPVSD